MPASEFTDDGFLDNRLKVLQPRKGYRAGLDAVMVAAAVPAKPGDHVFEAGIGTGVAALCLAKRVPGTQITGVEINPDYAALARENAARNGFENDITVATGDMAGLTETTSFAPGSFDHAFANPPYREQGKVRLPDDRGRRQAFVCNKGLVAQWTVTMVDLVGSGGTVTIILPVELDDAFRKLPIAARNRLTVLPLLPHDSAHPNRQIYRIEIDGNPGMQMVAPLVLHKPDGSYTVAADAVLRNMGELKLGEAST